MVSVRPDSGLLCSIPLALAVTVGARLHPAAATQAEIDPGSWDRLHAEHAPARTFDEPPPSDDDDEASSDDALDGPAVASDLAESESSADDEGEHESVDDIDDLAGEGDEDGYGSDDYDPYDDFWYGQWRQLLSRTYGHGGYGSGSSAWGGASASRPAYMFMSPSDGASSSGGVGSPFAAGNPLPFAQGGGGVAPGPAPSASSSAPTGTEDPGTMPTLENAHVRIRVDLGHLCRLEVEPVGDAPTSARAPTVLRFLLPGDDAGGCSVGARPAPTRGGQSMSIEWPGRSGAWVERVVLSLGTDDRVPSAAVVVVREEGQGATSWAANLSGGSVRFSATDGREITVEPGAVQRMDGAVEVAGVL